MIPTPPYFTDTKGHTRQFCPDCGRYLRIRRWPLRTLHRCSMALRKERT